MKQNSSTYGASTARISRVVFDAVYFWPIDNTLVSKSSHTLDFSPMLCIECDVISDELNTCDVMHSIFLYSVHLGTQRSNYKIKTPLMR